MYYRTITPVTIVFLLTMVGCAPKSSEPAPTETVLSQTQLNAITQVVKANATGAVEGTNSIGHVITDPIINADPSATFRDVLANTATLTGAIPQGTVVVKRIFLKNGGGNKADRSNVYVMVKQYAGYYPEGGDWSYYAIKYDPAVINANTPNGIIASALLTGKIGICQDCHKRAAPDFLYTTGSGGGSSY